MILAKIKRAILSQVNIETNVHIYKADVSEILHFTPKQFKWKHITVGNRKNVVVFCRVEHQKWMSE